jgi:hypothetical protein
MFLGDSGSRYIISWDLATDCWTCSCTGGTRHGYCKHLTRYDLEGRRDKARREQNEETAKAQAEADARAGKVAEPPKVLVARAVELRGMVYGPGTWLNELDFAPADLQKLLDRGVLVREGDVIGKAEAEKAARQNLKEAPRRPIPTGSPLVNPWTGSGYRDPLGPTVTPKPRPPAPPPPPRRAPPASPPSRRFAEDGEV